MVNNSSTRNCEKQVKKSCRKCLVKGMKIFQNKKKKKTKDIVVKDQAFFENEKQKLVAYSKNSCKMLESVS